MGDLDVLDYCAIAYHFLMMIIYHSFFLWAMRNRPLSISLGRNFRAQRAWTKFAMGADGRELLVVQSFRNSIMTASFFASTSAVVGFSAISFAYTSRVSGNSLLGIQIGILSLFFLLAFYNFAMIPRLLSHAGFLIQIKKRQMTEYTATNAKLSDLQHYDEEKGTKELLKAVDSGSLSPRAPEIDEDELFEHHIKVVQHSLVRQAVHFWCGMRCIYSAVPLALWVIGPFWYIAGTTIVAVLLLIHDVM